MSTEDHAHGSQRPEAEAAAQDQDGDGCEGENRHYRWKEISTRHWMETAKRCGFSEMKQIIEEVIARTPQVVEETSKLLPRGFPAQIAEPILTGTAKSARLLGENTAI